MTLSIHLLGRPRLQRSTGEPYRFRSRKSWAALTFLILSERPPSRARLAALLFADADDPGRALRWNLAEIRRGLGVGGSVDGDPVVLRLPDDVLVDVDVLSRGRWQDAVLLPNLDSELLAGMSFRGAPGFEAWLLAEQRRLAAASEAVLHEAALGSMSRGEIATALSLAVRVAAMDPLAENHQALLLRIYRLAGDDRAAATQLAAFTALLDSELGVAPGPAVLAAMHAGRPGRPAGDLAAIDAILEAGGAAVAAGAVAAGVQTLRTAVQLADSADATAQRVWSRLQLGEALVHSLRGMDEEGLAHLYQADEIATGHGLDLAVAQARAEIGYVDFLRANYDRAEVWLTQAGTLAADSLTERAKVATYLGSVESDRANYSRARELLLDAAALARAAAAPRREVYALTMLGRIALARGDLADAARVLDDAIGRAERDRWLAFLPFPQALRGEVLLAMGELRDAQDTLRQAFARACQLGDPCWEGLSAHGLALVAEAAGDADTAFGLLADARNRSNRHADPYVWLDGYILDAQCTFGRRHGHPGTTSWIDQLQELAGRTGMRELTVRSLLHSHALGVAGAGQAAELLAAEIDNPALHALIAAAMPDRTRVTMTGSVVTPVS